MMGKGVGKGEPKASCIIQVESASMAQRAIAGINGSPCAELGQPITVRFANRKYPDRPEPQPNNNIYVRGWPVGFPDFLLQDQFQKYGNVARVRILENPDP